MYRPTFPARLLAPLLIVLLAGCASTPKPPSQTPEEAVAERASLRWQALIEGRWEDSYALLTPGYREAHSLEAFKANFLGSAMKWLAATPTRVVCDQPQRCLASITIEFDLLVGMPGMSKTRGDTEVEEVWLQVGDGWYHLPRR